MDSIVNRLHEVFILVSDGRISLLKHMFDNISKFDVHYLINAIIDGQTPLLVAIKNNHYELVKYLVEDCKVDIEKTGTVNFGGESIQDASPLWLASSKGNQPIVRLLVENGANVNSMTTTKSSPLRAACYDGHLQVVMYLIEHGADVELANRYGHTCLMIAAYRGHLDIVKYLVEECGANVNRRSIKGNTALHDCAETGSDQIFQVLLDNNAKMIKDSCNVTPLMTAAVNGCESIVHLIINRGIDESTGKHDVSKSLCTEIERIDALELIGSTLIDKKRDISKGIYYWRTGFERRLKNIDRIMKGENLITGETVEVYKKKIAKPIAAYNYAKEFNSLEELEQIIANVDDIRMQSLIIRERILGQTFYDHTDSVYYIRFRGAVYADSGDFEICIKLWLYALDKQQKSLDPLSPLTQSSLFSFAELFSYMMSGKEDQLLFEDIFAVFKRSLFELKSAILMLPTKKAGQQNTGGAHKMKLLQRISGIELRDEDCLEEEVIRGVIENNFELNDFMQSNQNLDANEQLIKNTMNADDNLSNKTNDNLKNKDESINLHRILVIIRIFIGLLCRLKNQMTPDQLFRFKKAVYRLVKMNPIGDDGQTLLHQISLRDGSCQLIKSPNCEIPTNEIIQLLVECGANVNAFDNSNNTPLHFVTKNRPNNLAVQILLDNKAHIDVRNNDGESPLDFLTKDPSNLSRSGIYPMKHLSLQCLCAQTICKNNLSYKNVLSKQVCDFVKIH